MGGTTKLNFPLPHCRSKQPSLDVLSISAPLISKAQKRLGTAEINVDASSTAMPHESSRRWETRSTLPGVSNISLAASQTTVARLANGAEDHVENAGLRNRDRAAWDQESDITPKGLGLCGAEPLDVNTNTSSIRRRGSGSTVVSFYDKTKGLPSTSQQTPNSAMAKELPNEDAKLRDLEAPRPAPLPPSLPKRAPSKLDLTRLFSSFKLSKCIQKKGSMLVRPDLLTRSPPILSSSPGFSSSDQELRSEKNLKRVYAKESSLSLQGQRTGKRQVLGGVDNGCATLRDQATDMNNRPLLNDHNEKASMLQRDNSVAPVAASSGRSTTLNCDQGTITVQRHTSRVDPSSPPMEKSQHQVQVIPSFSAVSWTLFPKYTPRESYISTVENLRLSTPSSNMASHAGDFAASVSSRHTRTSRTSKRTESFADFDPNATSMLSLSSDSDDDEDPEPLKTAHSVPCVGSQDGSLVPTEFRRPLNTSDLQEPVRSHNKSRFHTTLNPKPAFSTIPEHDGPGPGSPKINTRSNLLGSAMATTTSPRISFSTTSPWVRPLSRLPQIATSTTQSTLNSPFHSHAQFSASSPRLVQVRHVAMLQAGAATPILKRHKSTLEQAHVSSQESAPTTTGSVSPISPSSTNASKRSRRDGFRVQVTPIRTRSSTDSAGCERVIALTKQEQRLLAAMRAKRTLMKKGGSQITTAVHSDSGSDTVQDGALKKESSSRIETPKAHTLKSVFTKVPAVHECKANEHASTIMQSSKLPSSTSRLAMSSKHDGKTETEKREQVLMCLDKPMSTTDTYDMAEPSPDLSDFIVHFGTNGLPSPRATKSNGAHFRDSATVLKPGNLASSERQHYRDSSFGCPRPDSEFMPVLKPAWPELAPPLPSHRLIHANYKCPPTADHEAEQKAEKEIIYRKALSPTFDPESPTSVYDDEEEPQPRNKAARISAVGPKLPEFGQWGDDG